MIALSLFFMAIAWFLGASLIMKWELEVGVLSPQHRLLFGFLTFLLGLSFPVQAIRFLLETSR